jgi:Ca2+-transporting ATPase
MAQYHNLDIAQTAAELKTDINTGLTAAEAQRRLAEGGRNVLPLGEETSLLKILISQFADVMVLMLLAAVAVSVFLREYSDAIVILVIVVLNAALGTYQEYRAEQALAALSAMQVPRVRIKRDGQVTEISAEELVPGDLVLLQEGDRIPADGRLVVAKSLNIEEAALTGESQPVEKTTSAISETDVPLGDRLNMAFMGTAINFGRGEMIVTGTGLKTELGKIAEMLMGVEEKQTPLQVQIHKLSLTLIRGALVVVALVFVIGLLRGFALDQMLITAIGLAVAAVPEGLPAIITVSLSLGAARMVKRHALIRKLPSVETLGSVTVICSDKTGTLTKNEMTATRLALPGIDDVDVSGIGYTPEGDFKIGQQSLDPKTDPQVGRFLKAMALDTDAYLERDDSGRFNVVGDTTEGALLVAAQKIGWTRQQLEKDLPRVAELPFSSERKAMTTVHEVIGTHADVLFDGKYIAITKGAPDRLIDWAKYEHRPEGTVELSPERRKIWYQHVDEMAAQGLRVLGVAYRPLESVPAEMKPEIERDLNLLGLVGILDPARPEAKEAVKTARQAGIRPIMITGDHALTAEAIAKDLGILREGERAITGAELEKMDEAQMVAALQRTSAFARVSPEHKLKLVKALQSTGEVAAMTGDGVNDAPALKQADIGVAMGITGTEVSKGAADMVLTDDNFASIVAAVEEGRTIYDNIRKFVRYLLSSNVGEILVMLVAILIGMPIPLLAIQILWINLVTDGLPAIALGFEPGEADVMNRPPRPKGESIFARGLGRQVVVLAVVLAVLTLIGFAYGHLIHGLDPFNAHTLGAEDKPRAELVTLVGEDEVPADWDTMTIGERVAVLEGDAAEGGGHEGSEGLLGALERIPRTIAFTVLALGQMFHVAGIHAGESVSFFRVGFKSNRLLLWAILSTFVLQLLVLYVPFLSNILDTYPISLLDLGVSLALAFIVLLATEADRIFFNNQKAAA